jgi:hypothetical protein
MLLVVRREKPDEQTVYDSKSLFVAPFFRNYDLCD